MSPLPDPGPEPYAWLRPITVVLAGAQALYWLWSLLVALRAFNSHSADGLGMAPAFFATPPFLVATLPALMLGALGLAPRIAFFLALMGAALTPFLFWQVALARFLDAGVL